MSQSQENIQTDGGTDNNRWKKRQMDRCTDLILQDPSCKARDPTRPVEEIEAFKSFFSFGPLNVMGLSSHIGSHVEL